MIPHIDIDDLQLTVTSRGEVREKDEAYARDKIRHLVAYTRAPVLFGEITLTQSADPARQRPSIAEAVLDVNGEPVRAQVAAHEMAAAIHLLENRLHRRLDRHDEVRDDRRERNLRHPEHEPHEWRHGEPRGQRPEYFDRPVDERQLVRHKTYASGEMTPDEAADALDLLGHDFLLFTNIVTGADAVIFYDEEHGLELIDASNRDDAVGPDTVAPIRLSKFVARHASVAEAIEELDLDLTRFVFFVDARSDRGNVAYHRYDGHYGVITPA
jgi:ribosome-associated translation inhibitor RaiA